MPFFSPLRSPMTRTVNLALVQCECLTCKQSVIGIIKSFTGN